MRWLVLTGFICVAAISGCGESGEVRVGERAPSFRLEALDGSWVESSDFEGDIVVLNFWATWCTPCMKEIPELVELEAASAFRVVGIALDAEGAEAVRPFVERNHMNYTVLLGDEEVFQLFNGYGIPYTLVLDREQKIVRIYHGPVTRERLERDLKEIM